MAWACRIRLRPTLHMCVSRMGCAGAAFSSPCCSAGKPASRELAPLCACTFAHARLEGACLQQAPLPVVSTMLAGTLLTHASTALSNIRMLKVYTSHWMSFRTLTRNRPASTGCPPCGGRHAGGPALLPGVRAAASNTCMLVSFNSSQA